MLLRCTPRRLCLPHLIAPFLALRFQLLLLCCALLLLRLQHLLSRRFLLRLLLLTLRLALVLLTKWLPHLLALRLCVSAFGLPFSHLLLPQVLQLLASIPISARGLFRKVRHLSLTCLFCRNVGRLRSLRRRGPLIRDL